MASKVKVDPVVLEQLTEIRDSGLTNMFDFNMVQRLAYENDYYELVDWMEKHRDQYGNLIMYGPDES